MYEIYLESGKLLTYTDSIYFIRKSSSGSLIPSTEDNAEGISINNIPYNILGIDKLDDSYETIYFIKIDSGKILSTCSNNIDNLIVNLLEG